LSVTSVASILAVANKPDMKISETKYINTNIAGLPQKSMSFYSLN